MPSLTIAKKKMRWCRMRLASTMLRSAMAEDMGSSSVKFTAFITMTRSPQTMKGQIIHRALWLERTRIRRFLPPLAATWTFWGIQPLESQ